MKTQPLLRAHTQPLDEKQTQPLAGFTIEEEAKIPGKTDPGAPRRSIREIIQDLRRAKAEGGQS